MSLLLTRSKTHSGATSREDEALAFLREHQTGVLATASPDGRPHASAIYYAVDALLNVTFITKRRTRKSDNLRINNRAEMVVYDEASQTTVELSGKVVELNDPEEASQAFRGALRASLRTAESAVPPVAKLAAGSYVAYRLKTDLVHMAVYNRRGTKQPKNMIETIDRRN